MELIRQPRSNAPIRAQFSPDGRWLAFHRTETTVTRRILIAAFRDKQPLPDEAEWISVTDGSGLEREAAWSPDGNLLYFFSEREGFRCLWAQRLNPVTKHPVGAALEVFHSHRARLSLMNFSDSGWAAPSVARDKIVFSMGERTGNIWMTQLDGQK